MKTDISNIIDYFNNNRIRVKISKNDDGIGNRLVLGKQIYVYINNEELILNINDIKKVRLSMCSRLYNAGIIESNIAKLAVKSITKGAIGTYGQHLKYYLDIDFVYNDKVLMFENENTYNCLEIVDYFKSNNVLIDDPLGLEKIYKDHQDQLMLVKYLNYNFPKLAKKHNLDNPRGIETIK